MNNVRRNAIKYNYKSVYDSSLSLGYRILAFASTTLPEGCDVSSIPRDELESGLTFLGFLVLANRLKPETRVVMDELKRAGNFCVL